MKSIPPLKFNIHVDAVIYKIINLNINTAVGI